MVAKEFTTNLKRSACAGQVAAQTAHPHSKPVLHGGTDAQFQPQRNQAGPSRSLQVDMASNNPQLQGSYVPVHPFAPEQTLHRYVDLTQLHQPANHFYVPQEYTLTSIDEKQGNLRHPSGGGMSEPRNPHGVSDPHANPLMASEQAGVETSNDKAGDGLG